MSAVVIPSTSKNSQQLAGTTPTAAGLTLLDDASAAAQRTTLGLAIGSNVQAYSANLVTYAGIAPSANIQSLLGSADYAAFRTSLSLVVGTNVQAFNSNLTTYAGITPSANVQTLLGSSNYSAFRTSLGTNDAANIDTGALSLTHGGTGAISASLARTSLGTNDAANITTGALAIANGGSGGTGGSVWSTQATFGNTNVAASTTYYFSGQPASGSALFTLSTTLGFHRVYVSRACKITAVTGNIGVASTLGVHTSNCTLKVKINGTGTAQAVSANLLMSSASNVINVTGLSISLAAGDYYELELNTGTFSQLPTNVNGQLTVEYSY